MKTFTILLAAILFISIGNAQRRDKGDIRGDDGGRLERVGKKPIIVPTKPIVVEPVEKINPQLPSPDNCLYRPALTEIIEIYIEPVRPLLHPDESTIMDYHLYLTLKQSAISNFNDEEYLTAINELTDAINDDPFDAELFLYMGRCYLGLNEYDDAIKQFTTAIKLDSVYGDAYYYRGLSKYYIGKRNEASVDLITARSFGNEQAASILRKYFHI